MSIGTMAFIVDLAYDTDWPISYTDNNILKVSLWYDVITVIPELINHAYYLETNQWKLEWQFGVQVHPVTCIPTNTNWGAVPNT